MGELRDFLTGTASGTHRLFDTLNAVAGLIAQAFPKPGQTPVQRQKNLNAALIQVDLGFRRCTPELERMIVHVLQERLAPESQSAAVRNAVRTAQEIIRSARERELPRQDSDREFRDLVRRAREAGDHFIVANATLENMLASTCGKSPPRANELSEILIERLGLSTGEGGGFAANGVESRPYIAQPSTRYRFCLRSEEQCRKHWTQLFLEVAGAIPGRKIAEAPTPVEAAQALTRIEELGKLVVMVRPERINPVPLVVYDVGGPDAEGFCLSYDEKARRVSVAKLSELDLSVWTYEAYIPAMELHQNVVKWKDVQQGAMEIAERLVSR